MENISYDEFKKMDMRLGTIKEVSAVEGADKLLKCMVDVGDTAEDGQVKLRQIVSGIKEFYPEYGNLVGKQVLYIVNLEPRMIKGVESNGMLMAVDGMDGQPVFLIPEVSVKAGSRVR